MRTFEGKRQRRPRVMAAAAVLALAGAAAGVTAAITAGDRGARVMPWLVIGGLVAAWTVMMLAMSARRASITVDGREVRASWRARPFVAEEVLAGRWVLGGIDTPTGALLDLRGGGGRLRIGGSHHDGAGYPRAARSRAVDLAIDAAAFDELAALLGVARGDPDELAVELVRSSQSARGLLSTMGPWLITLAMFCAFGAVLGLTGAGDWMTRQPHGGVILGGTTAAITIAGITITIVRSLRAKEPSLIVQGTGAGLALVRAGGDEIARASWSALRAEPRRHVTHGRTGSTTVAVIVLAIGDESLAIGAYDAGEPWPDAAPRVRRAPRWLAGGPQWVRLIAELRAHGALRA